MDPVKAADSSPRPRLLFLGVSLAVWVLPQVIKGAAGPVVGINLLFLLGPLGFSLTIIASFLAIFKIVAERQWRDWRSWVSMGLVALAVWYAMYYVPWLIQRKGVP